MKILYIAHDRNDAQIAAGALRPMAPDLLVSWASRLEDAAHWIFSNRDLAALILDVQFGDEPCASFLNQLRRRGLTAPAIVITSDATRASFESLGLGADDCIVKKATLTKDLPVAAKRAIDRGRVTTTRDGLTLKIAEVQAALDRAERARAADAAAAADQLAQRSHAFATSLADVIRSRDALEQRLNEAARTLETARREREAAGVTAAGRQAELETRIEQEVTTRTAAERNLTILRQKLNDAQAALETTRERHATESAAAAAEYVEREARHDAELAQLTAGRQALEQQLAEHESALRRVQDLRASEALKAADLNAALTDAAAVRGTLELALTDANRAIAEVDARRQAAEARERDAEARTQEADARTMREQVSARERQTQIEARLAAREAELEDQLHQETDHRRAVGEALARSERTRQEADERHLAAMAAATAELRNRQVRFEAELTQAQTANETVTRRLDESERARREAEELATRQRHDAAEQAARAVAELEARLAQELGARQAIEERLVCAEAVLRDAADRHMFEMAAADKRLAEREHDLGIQLAEITAVRDRVNQQLVQSAAELQAVQDRFAREQREAVEQAARRETDFEGQMGQEVEKRLELGERLANSEAARHAADERHASAMASASAEIAERQLQFESQLAKAAQIQVELESRLDLARDERHATEGRLADAEVARRDAEARHAAEMAVLVTQFGEREARLDGELTEATTALTERQAEFESRLADDESRRLSLERELEGTRAAAEAAQQLFLEELASLAARAEEQLATVSEQFVRERQEEREGLEQARLSAEAEARRFADQAAHQLHLLDETRVQAHREFEEHPLPLCRCTRDGVLTHANRAFAAMIGSPSADAAQTVKLAAERFDESRDLAWFIERSLAAGPAASIEANWRKVDGSRLVVRLSGLATPQALHVAIEDITAHRALQDRLSQAQRMEAVGRLASEVAVTCGNLLRDVSEDGQRWLATFDGHTALRQHGERLLGEVTRAAGFLQQFTEYGDEQATAVHPVDVHRVLRDLEPVLQEVAGDDIELVLPDRQQAELPPFNVDLKAERVERLLVNLASYSRERMPSGGTMIFDLAPALIDRQFIERHPNVRQGPHVVLTVTEARAAMRSMGPYGLQQELAEANDAPIERPGVDLGALQGLVRECGGHLWMEAKPAGDMVIRIHLPLQSA